MGRLRIFVSHSSADVAFCEPLVAALRDAGADVWYDQDNLPSGPIRRVIERELRSRPIFIVILSNAALDSRWVEEECESAYDLWDEDRSRTILPVTASAFDRRRLRLFLGKFKRIEAPCGQPYASDSVIFEVLKALRMPTPQLNVRQPDVPSRSPLTITSTLGFSLGVLSVDYSSSPPREVVHNLFRIRDSVPASVTKTYAAVRDNQLSVEIRLFESKEVMETVLDMSRVHEAGIVRVELPPGLKAGTPIDVTYEINEAGTLSIRWQITQTGNNGYAIFKPIQ